MRQAQNRVATWSANKSRWTTSLYNGLTEFTTTSVQSSKCLNCPGYIRKQNLASKAKPSQSRTSTARSPHITEEIPLLKLTAISKTTCSDSNAPPNHVQDDILDLLDHETLDLVLNSTDLSGQVTSLVGSDRGSNHGAGNTSSTTESHLARNVNVGNLI